MAKLIEAIEVGVTALRDPITREFLPAVPLYIEKTERTEENEAALQRDIARIFAGKYGKYVEGGGLTGNADAEERRRKETRGKGNAAADKPLQEKESCQKVDQTLPLLPSCK